MDEPDYVAGNNMLTKFKIFCNAISNDPGKRKRINSKKRFQFDIKIAFFFRTINYLNDRISQFSSISNF